MNCGTWLATVTLLFVLVLERIACGIFSQEPGFRVLLTKKGLEYVFGPVLKDGLSQLRLHDINDEKKVKIVGKVEYWLTDISVKEVITPGTSLGGGEGELTIHISDMSLSMSAKWKYKQKSWPKIGDDGRVDIKAKGVSLGQTVSVKNDGSGRIQLYSAACTFDVNKISVKFHGGASWLYNLFTSYIEKRIKDELKSQVCKMVTDGVDTLARDDVANLPLSIHVSDEAEVSCALIGDPIVSSSYILTNHDGEFISTQHPHEVPLSPQPLPPASSVDHTNKMAYMWLTSYTFDTAAYVYREAAYMEYYMKHDEIPNFLPRTTADFKFIVPQLNQVFPNVDVAYGIRATQPPTLLLSTGQAKVVGETEMYVDIIGSDKSCQLGLSLTVSVECSVDLIVQTRPSGLFVAGEVSSFTTDVIATNSNIGEFNLTPFENLLDTMARFLLVPNINRILWTGQVLPSHSNLRATNTVVSIEEGFVVVGTDFSFSS